MTPLSVGVMDTAPIAAQPAPDLLARTGYLAAIASRVDSYWIPDHINGLIPRAMWNRTYIGAARLIPRADAYAEAWTMLGYLAAHKRLGRLRLGIGVTDAGRRNPAVTAQAVATMHHLTRGRAILGIGPGEREGNQPYGVDWSQPVARFEDALATIRALWDSRGEVVNRDSHHFPLRDAIFALPPYRGSWPEIWVAAHGPRMLAAAGRFGDAWFPGFPHRPAQYGQRLDVVRTAASNHGRDPQAITPAVCFAVITGRTTDEVSEALDSSIAKAWALNAPAEIFAHHGAQHPLGADFSGSQDILPFTMDEETALSFAARVPPAVVRAACLSGTPAEVVDQVADWRDHGVRYVVVSNLSVLQPSLRKAFFATLPFIQIICRLKKL